VFLRPQPYFSPRLQAGVLREACTTWISEAKLLFQGRLIRILRRQRASTVITRSRLRKRIIEMLRLRVLASVFSSIVLVYFLLPAAFAWGQITNVTGDQAPPIEGAGHDYIKMLDETVNPATGSVSIRIGIPGPGGRGISVPFAIGYDSNAALHYNPTFGWQDNSGFIGAGGWGYLLPYLGVTVNAIVSQNGQSICKYFTDYVLTDVGGASHNLYTSTIEPLDSECQSYYGAPPGGLSNYYAGGDAQVQAATSTQTGWTLPAVTVADTNGTVYSFPATSSGFVANNGSAWQLFPTIEDRNGNEVSISATAGPTSLSVTDTLGRTALSVSGFGSTGNTVTIPGESAYTLTWGTVTPTSSFPFSGNRTNSPGCGVQSGASGSHSRITAISLPNGKSYQFQYDSVTGLLSKIIYPTGGYARYTWVMTSSPFDGIGWESNYQGGWTACVAQYNDYVLQKRFVSYDGVNEVQEQDFSYVVTWNGVTLPWIQRQTTVTTKDLSLGTSFNTVYTYSPMLIPNQPNDYTVPGSGAIPVETMIQYYDTNGSLLRTVQKSYVDPHLPPDETDTLGNNQVSRSHRVYSSLWPSSASSPACGHSGQYCLAALTDVYRYDYGSGAPGAVLKQTHIDYASFQNTPIFPSEPSILNRPSDVITDDGSGNKMAETDFAYDQTAVSAISATGHDNVNYSSSSAVARGNATTKTVKCLQSGCSNTVITFAYDETGQVTSTVDPCGNATCGDMAGTNHTTTYSYADSYTVLSSGQNNTYTPSGDTNAYLTQITDPLGHVRSFTYDFNNGQLTKSTDPNNQSTSYVYNDPFARPTLINYPNFGEVEIVYNDTAPSPTVTRCELISGTAGSPCSSTSPPPGWKTSTETMDGLGHGVQTELASDPDGATYTATSYDGLGRPYKTWNPTRCSPPTTNCGTETSWGFTTFTYDALGRTTNILKPDGSSTSTSFSGNQTTSTDEIGNQRKTQTDGLGRLTSVWEAPAAAGYNLESDYQYDALDNLICSVQKGTDTTAFTTCATASATWRPRSFAYDSLSRLTSATNPESGTIAYTYDLDGNVATRLTPKAGQTGTSQTTTTYTYDVLNRLLKKAYANPSAGNVSYGYDGTSPSSCSGPSVPIINSPTNLIGRRSAMCAAQSSSAWSFDSVGRVLIDSRANHGAATKTLTTSYSYNKDGSLNLITYPSGDVVNYTVGNAGRVTQVSDATNNYVGYLSPATPATYAPNGALATMTQGQTSSFAGIVTVNTYNNRLQPILMSATVSSTPVFSLCYDYHLSVAVNSPPCSFSASTSGDNGNVYRVLNNIDATRSTIYAYDPVNRISQANTITTSGSNCWGEVYSIDPWGNLSGRGPVTGMTGCGYEGLSASPSTKNQLSSVLYDAAGNVTNDGLGNQPTYDSENRISSDAGVTYYYDADGVRIAKTSGTMYWPGSNGTLTETDLTGTVSAEYVYFNGQRIVRNSFTLPNPGFEQGSADWTLYPTGASIVTSSRAHSGSNYLQISTSTGSNAVSTNVIPVSVGDVIIFGGWVYRESGTGYPQWKVELQDANHSPVSYPGGFNPAAGSWQYQLQTVTVPTGVSYAVLYCELYLPTNASVARFDDGFLNLTRYYFSDHLGSASVVSDAGGNIQQRYFYYPYGGMQSSSGSDPNHYKFTGKERDTESGLDNFGARYFGSSLSRFMTPDWSSKPQGVPYAVLGDPQSLNLYTYARNNPTTLYDPDGHCWSWAQWFCNTAQRINNFNHNLGFRTNVQVDAVVKQGINNLRRSGFSAEGLSRAALVSAGARKLGTRTWQTYLMRHPDLEPYAGRTSGFGTPEENVAARTSAARHDMRGQGYGPGELDKSSNNPDAIRGREQQLIDANGGAQSKGGTSGNAINGVGEDNPKREQYMKAAEKEFGPAEAGQAAEAAEDAEGAEGAIEAIEILNSIPE
jgi:RHS repeat-associated protein